MSEGDVESRAVGDLADRLFRHESGRLRAVLIRILGVARLDLADDIVQESLLAALRLWRVRGVPDNPGAWLTRVAQRKAIDLVRRDRRHGAAEAALVAWSRQKRGEGADPRGGGAVVDDTLRLMFMSAHPTLTPQDRVLVTLALVAGFGGAELARAFLSTRGAIEQRLTRSKRAIRECGEPLDLPDTEGLGARIGSVLDTLYLMLNEGFAAHAGDEFVRRELIEEARRLLGVLLSDPRVGSEHAPEIHALAALSCFIAARTEARTDALGGLVLLEHQDRARWDRALILKGLGHLESSRAGGSVSAHGLEAAIAACHAVAPNFDATDWAKIVELYEILELVKPASVVTLNRAVALAMRDGPEAGLRLIGVLEGSDLADRYHLVEATRGAILQRAGRSREAAAAFRLALSLPCSEPERALLRGRLAEAERDSG